MDPVTLHFNIFQAGSPVRKSLQVDDTKGTTILALKQQLFPDELKACKSVRFISGGKMLDDGSAIDKCKLGSEAHIHVSISERQRTSSEQSEVDASPSAPEATTSELSSEESSSDMSMVSLALILGAVFFTGTGAALFVALRKRYQYKFSMHTSQLLFICAAIWVYLLVCHGLPALYQALSKIGHAPRVAASPKNLSQRPAGNAASAGLVEEAPSASSSPATAASSPGLSLMTPTLPAGDAVTAASVLTQRR